MQKPIRIGVARTLKGVFSEGAHCSTQSVLTQQLSCWSRFLARSHLRRSAVASNSANVTLDKPVCDRNSSCAPRLIRRGVKKQLQTRKKHTSASTEQSPESRELAF